VQSIEKLERKAFKKRKHALFLNAKRSKRSDETEAAQN